MHPVNTRSSSEPESTSPVSPSTTGSGCPSRAASLRPTRRQNAGFTRAHRLHRHHHGRSTARRRRAHPRRPSTRPGRRAIDTMTETDPVAIFRTVLGESSLPMAATQGRSHLVVCAVPTPVGDAPAAAHECHKSNRFLAHDSCHHARRGGPAFGAPGRPATATSLLLRRLGGRSDPAGRLTAEHRAVPSSLPMAHARDGRGSSRRPCLRPPPGPPRSVGRRVARHRHRRTVTAAPAGPPRAAPAPTGGGPGLPGGPRFHPPRRGSGCARGRCGTRRPPYQAATSRAARPGHRARRLRQSSQGCDEVVGLPQSSRKCQTTVWSSSSETVEEPWS